MNICFFGPVIKGKGLGNTVGMPTLNLDWASSAPDPLPPFGVYFSKIFMDGNIYFGLTNFGYRPSVDDEERITLETFFLRYIEGPLGQEAEVCLLEFIRPTKKFSDLQEVKKQVDLDLSYARELLAQEKREENFNF